MCFSPNRRKTATTRPFFSTLFGTSSSSTLCVADLKPPQAPPVWTHTPEDVLSLTKEAIERDRVVNDQVGKLPDSECNFNTVFSALALSSGDLETVTKPLLFYQQVSPSKELRDASHEAEKLINDHLLECSLRQDVYNAKVTVKNKLNTKFSWFKQRHSLEERGLMIINADRLSKRGKWFQLHTTPKFAKTNHSNEHQKQWKEQWEELRQVCVEFKKNFNDENGFVSFTLKELEGVPQDVISSYAKHIEDGEELYDVTHKLWDISPLFKYAQNAETRQRAYESYEAGLELNAPLLDHAIKLRHSLANRLLGNFESWADYKTHGRMAKNGDNVEKFLADLEQTLHPLGVQEHENLLQLKADELKAKGEPFDGELYIWDHQYYEHLYLEKFPHLKLDHDYIKEYFPASAVIPATLEIFQNFFGVSFHEVKGSQAWHPDVQLFAVWNADAKDESDFMGYCYLDLFQCASKSVCDCNVDIWPPGLCPGYLLANGKRVYPVAAMVANFATNCPGAPALMLHSDVIWFFHQMGHIFHDLLACTKFSVYHGTRAPLDFKEAPSQLVENWCWEPKVLKKISRHYKTNEVLSDDLVEKVIKSRYVNVGLDYLHRLFLASFDLQVHTHLNKGNEKQDTTALWNDLREHISLLKSGSRSIAGQGSFTGPVMGYDAGSYASLYSEVWVDDMYSTIFKDDPLDPKLGGRYWKKILQPGGSRRPYDSLWYFLGRPPKRDAFKEKIKKLIRDHDND